MGPASRAFAVPAAGGVIIGGRAIIRGYSVRENNNAVATVKLWDNATTNSGLLLWSLNLAANGYDKVWPGLSGIAVEQGLYAEVTAGAVDWTIYLSAETVIDARWAVYDDVEDDVTRTHLANLAALMGA